MLLLAAGRAYPGAQPEAGQEEEGEGGEGEEEKSVSVSVY